MTEYDYSPEAYQRYLATQTRIANWVDKTEQHRPQFQHAVPSGPIADAPLQPSSSSHSRQRRRHHPGQAQPRQLFIHVPPPDSESSDDYADVLGPCRSPPQP
ncbi:hypothetical protein NLJ89_g10758 [Agrocybe chaxingu]|uniref:Uncharacterized protein n=1 Tax=Agrocybe chaxingu TaxID=84603 RepID=A0A9W8JTN4_9AGAR|nr:hypothetical protein NLJ89_g10758 [Agrocybe chaxingu]